MFVGERREQLTIKLSVFKEKKYSYLYDNLWQFKWREKLQNFSGVRFLQDFPTVFGTNLVCLPNLALLKFFSTCKIIFPIIDQSRFFFSEIGPNILMNVLENCIHYKKYRNFIWFSGVEILRKGTVSSKFRANRPKLSGNCAFP